MSQGKKRTLEELFKPPLDIMFKGDWQSARDAATAANKWLLVNIQDAGEFQCQTLNRDVWSNDAVKTIIREHFLFWQVKNSLNS
jgi:thioredoxin-related protein